MSQEEMIDSIKKVWVELMRLHALQPLKPVLVRQRACFFHEKKKGSLRWEHLFIRPCIPFSVPCTQDYSVSYFVSGAGDMAAYADECVFADPFVAFRGKALGHTNEISYFQVPF